MSNYEFALENVLRFRTIQKNLQQASLQDALSEYDRLQRELDDCQSRITRLEQELTPHDGSRVDVKSIIINRSFIRCLRLEENRLHKSLRDQEEEIDNRKAQLVERSREEKIMVKLKERNYHAFLDEERRRTDKETDEMVLIRRPHAAASSM